MDRHIIVDVILISMTAIICDFIGDGIEHLGIFVVISLICGIGMNAFIGVYDRHREVEIIEYVVRSGIIATLSISTFFLVCDGINKPAIIVYTVLNAILLPANHYIFIKMEL